jgi:NACHT domain
MSRHRTSVILIALAVVLGAALEFLIHLLHGEVKTWLEQQPWYSLRTLSLAAAGLLAAIIAVELWQKRAEASDEKAHSSSAPLNPALRLRLLDKIKNERVDATLRQGLRKALRVDLGLTEIPGAVHRKLRVYAIAEGGTLTDRPIARVIQDIFENTAGGQLLILGDPGTGKTNLLLELADSLIKEAKSNQALPIPVVFNLPRWTLGKDARTLGEWLVDDLSTQYGLSRTTANALILQDRILPLLDGLDEVSSSRRAACANAITAFQKERDLGRVVVCCRTTEYAGLPRLALGTAVRVEKLARADAEREIARPRLERARQMLESDPELWQVIDTPLWLHVLYAASQVEPSKRGTSVDPRDWLYAHYLEYALGRETDDSPRRRTAREPMLRWLGWLAAQMRNHAQTQFAFENLNATWICPERTFRAVGWFPIGLAALAFGLGTGLVGGLGMGLVSGPDWGLTGGLSWGLTGGLCGGLYSWLVGRMYPVEEVEELHLSWQGFGIGLFGGLVGGLAFGQVGGLVGGLAFGLAFWRFGGLIVGLVFGLGVGFGGGLAVWRFGGLVGGLIVGLCLGLSFGLAVGLQPQSVSQHSAPNRGTLRSVHYAFWIVLSSVTLALTFLFLARHLWAHVLPSIVPVLFFTTGIGFTLALNKGGYFALRHYNTRLFLGWLGVAPLRYVRFLNEATERLFLIRHGGSYEFLHVTFRDYMARVHAPNANVQAASEPKG